MTENVLENVFVVVNFSAELTDIDARLAELSSYRIRGAWFAHDAAADIIDDLSDAVYDTRAAAEERAHDFDDDHAPFPLNAALMNALVTHYRAGGGELDSDDSETDSESSSESLSELFE